MYYSQAAREHFEQAQGWTHLCTKCGWEGRTAEHEGCGYLALEFPPQHAQVAEPVGVIKEFISRWLTFFNLLDSPPVSQESLEVAASLLQGIADRNHPGYAEKLQPVIDLLESLKEAP